MQQYLFKTCKAWTWLYHVVAVGRLFILAEFFWLVFSVNVLKKMLQNTWLSVKQDSILLFKALRSKRRAYLPMLTDEAGRRRINSELSKDDTEKSLNRNKMEVWQSVSTWNAGLWRSFWSCGKEKGSKWGRIQKEICVNCYISLIKLDKCDIYSPLGLNYI